MFTFLNTVSLFLFLISGVIYFGGLGWLTVGSLLRKDGIFKKKEHLTVLQELPVIITVGLIINYGLILIFRELSITIVIGIFLSLIGLCGYGLHFYRVHFRNTINAAYFTRVLCITFVCIYLLGPIISQPLEDWDARSNWFFPGRMIYVEGALNQSAGWNHEGMEFSHPYYPKLVPALAAQSAYVMGFWNEYLPKISLFFLLVPPVIWLFSFTGKSWSFLFLIFLFPFFFHKMLWNGYLDGYFALYFSISLLLFGRFLKYFHPVDMVGALVCLILLPYLKQEGVLALFSALTVMAVSLFMVRKEHPLNYRAIFTNIKHYIITIILLAPLFLWGIYKERWGLSSDIEPFAIDSFIRLTERIEEGDLWMILDYTQYMLNTALLILGIFYFALVALKKDFPVQALVVLLTALIYCGGLTFVDLIIPRDLELVLDTIKYRTMLSVNGLIYISCYFLFLKIEDRSVPPH